MTCDRLFFCATGFILALLSPCVGAQTRSEKIPLDAEGYHEQCDAGTVCQVGVYACPDNVACIVHVKVERANEVCSFKLFAPVKKGDKIVETEFFYIDRSKGESAPIIWKLQDKEIFEPKENGGGIQVPNVRPELFKFEESQVTWYIGKNNALAPLILYNVKVQKCKGWGPGIINRG